MVTKGLLSNLLVRVSIWRANRELSAGESCSIFEKDVHPRKPSAKAHSVGADMGSEISTPLTVTVAI